MKKKFLLLSLLLCIVATGCQEELIEQSQNDSSVSTGIISSSITPYVMENINDQLSLLLGSDTRAAIIDEYSAKQILQPLVIDGKNIRYQLLEKLEASNVVEFTEEDIQLLQNLDDSQLANLSYLIYQISYIADRPSDLTQYMSAYETVYETSKEDLILIDYEKPYDFQLVQECLLQSLGFFDLMAIYEVLSTTGDLIVAGEAAVETVGWKTLREVIKVIGKRFLGIVGVAMLIYDVHDCLESRTQNP